MWKPSIVAVGLICCSFTYLFAQSAESPELPPGAMQPKVTTACTECHGSRIILQQRLGKGAWTKEVDKMTKWGALVDPADRDGFIDYLSSNFTPDKAPAVMPRAASKNLGSDSKSKR